MVIPITVESPVIEGLSPEGSALLAKSRVHDSEGSLRQVPLPQGQPRPLGATEVQDATFFPGGRILFSRKGDLYVSEQDGSNPRKIVSVDGVIRN